MAQPLPPDFLKRLSQSKRKATAADLARYGAPGGTPGINVDGLFVPLLTEGNDDRLDDSERLDAVANTTLWDAATNAPAYFGATPAYLDRRPQQTPVRDQLDRGTCVCFASLAALEAALPDAEKTVLSPQYANWLFMQQEAKTQCEDGLRTTLAAGYLSEDGVCPELDAPYEDKATVATHCDGAPSATATAAARFGIAGYTLIDRLGLMGPSISNPEYLETLLFAGYDVVFGTEVAWGDPDANGVYDVLLDTFGNPLQSQGGHAMSIVGYCRDAPVPYVIVKNSWGTHVGHAGYFYFSYDYIRTYAKYGFIITSVRTDMVPSE